MEEERQWQRWMGSENHLLDLHGWWRHSHIPTRGEEEGGRFLRCPAVLATALNHPQISQWGGVVLMTRWSLDECSGTCGHRIALVVVMKHITYLFRGL